MKCVKLLLLVSNVYRKKNVVQTFTSEEKDEESIFEVQFGKIRVFSANWKIDNFYFNPLRFSFSIFVLFFA